MMTRLPENYLLHKLKHASLFQTYSQAFEVATGFHLDLTDDENETNHACHSIPINGGKAERLYLMICQSEEIDFVEKEIERSILGLARAFALQLSDEVNRAVLESDGAEPSCLQAAKHYIQENLRTKIQLQGVANAVDVCSFQLCRLFKSHTGMTMTEYVSRKRVENARMKLQDPSLQVAEVARETGFTSLSQFNRNFLKYAGESPSEYRVRMEKFEHCELLHF